MELRPAVGIEVTALVCSAADTAAAAACLRMACIVELTRPETCFDPEAVIIILSASLEEAWNRLLRSGSECTRPAYARAMREVLAKRIFDLAQEVSLTKKNLPMVRSVFWR